MDIIFRKLENFGERRTWIPNFSDAVVKPVIFGVTLIGGTVFLINSQWWKRRKQQQNSSNEAIHWTRRWGQIGPSWWETLNETNRTLVILGGINSATFILWQFPQLESFMRAWFLSGPRNSYKLAPLLLSCFSHYQADHFVMNMVSMYTAVPPVQEALGRGQVIAIYISGGVLGSIVSLLVRWFNKEYNSYSHGASGSLFALLLSSLCIFIHNTRPNSNELFHIIGERVLNIVLCMFGSQGIDNAGHLGGALFGWVYTNYLLKRILRR